MPKYTQTSMTMRPIGAPPIVMSKNTFGFGIACTWMCTASNFAPAQSTGHFSPQGWVLQHIRLATCNNICSLIRWTRRVHSVWEDCSTSSHITTAGFLNNYTQQQATVTWTCLCLFKFTCTTNISQIFVWYQWTFDDSSFCFHFFEDLNKIDGQ